MKKLTIIIFCSLAFVVSVFSQQLYNTKAINTDSLFGTKSAYPIINWYTGFDPGEDTSTFFGLKKIGHFNAPNNLWQIGRPLKPYPLDSTYTPPNVLITDTVNPYPVNANSSFEMHFGRIPYFASSCWSYSVLIFSYRIDADSAKDGMYVEIMYNGDNNWKNIIFDTMADIFDTSNIPYRYTDTLFNGEPGISFHSHDIQGWNQFSVEWQWNNVHAHIVDSVAFRVTFISDSINTNKGGVLIDEIDFVVQDMCSMNIDKISKDDLIKLYPNPVNSESVIEFTELSDYDISITDVTGKTVLKTRCSKSNFLLGKQNLYPGWYCYKITGNNQCFNGKFIVQP